MIAVIAAVRILKIFLFLPRQPDASVRIADWPLTGRWGVDHIGAELRRDSRFSLNGMLPI